MRTHSTKRKNQSLTGNENKDCPELYVINIKTHEKREKNPDNSNIAIRKRNQGLIGNENRVIWVDTTQTRHTKRNMDYTNNNCMHYPTVYTNVYLFWGPLYA